MKRILLVAWLMVAPAAYAAVPPLPSTKPVAKDFSSWRKFTTGKLLAETSAIPPGASGRVGLYITLEGNWHTYWVNPGDSGTSLRLEFHNSPGVRVVRVDMPPPERHVTGPLISFAYSKEVLFPIELEIDRAVVPGSTAHIEVTAEWLVCDQVCLPAFDTFRLDVPVAALSAVKPTESFALFQKYLRGLPKKVPAEIVYAEVGPNVMKLEVPVWTPNREFIDFFPFRGSGVTNKKPVASGAAPLVLTFEKSSVPQAAKDRIGLLVSRDNTTGTFEAWQFGEPQWEFAQVESEGQAPVDGQKLLWMLLSAFLGGLILNLMPCVFPILSIKLLGILKIGKGHQREIRQQNLAYVAGVLLSFVFIALILSALRSAGSLVGWGFQLQSAVFLVFLCWLFFVLTLNLVGLFEIEFLNAGAGHRLTKLGGLWGSFFTGVLAVVVASPCTAPFMGVALGFGLTQPTPVLLAVFLCLGVGLAFPYLLITAFPHTLKFLPKPGTWMIRVKQVMAVPMLLTVVWLSWVLGQVAGGFAIGVVMVGCGFVALAVLIRGRVLTRFAVTMLALLGLMFYVQTRVERVAVRPAVNESEGPWRSFTPELLASLKGQNVFVNMTADWCLTCKVNERLVFDDPEIMELLREKNVVLVKGDWTQKNADITRFLSGYNRVGVPFYVLFSPHNPAGQVLPEVLTKRSFKDWILKEFP